MSDLETKLAQISTVINQIDDPKVPRNIRKGAKDACTQWLLNKGKQMDVRIAITQNKLEELYEDPNIRELVKEGTIRHFDTVKDAIDRGEINIKPGFPKWDSIEGEMLNQLNQVIRGNLSPRDALNIIQKRADDVGPFTF